jgi:hypothetical protein
MVGACKPIIKPEVYSFVLATYATFDVESTWGEVRVLQLLAERAGIADLAVAFDGMGDAYPVTLPFAPGTPRAIAAI